MEQLQKQSILTRSLNELSRESVYQPIINLLDKNKKLLDSTLTKELYDNIKPPQKLITDTIGIRIHFTMNPGFHHEIFKTIKYNIEKVNEINSLIIINEDNEKQINSSTISTKTLSSIKLGCSQPTPTIVLKELKFFLTKYCEIHQSFIYQLIEKAKSSISDLYDECPLILNDDLKYRELDSLTLAYRIISYDMAEHDFIRKFDKGTSLGIEINGVYFKVDNGCGFLRPAKENSVFEFFKDLYPQSFKTSAFVSPTKFMIVCQVPILPQDPELSKRKELTDFKILYNTNKTKSVCMRNLELERNIKMSLVRTNVSTQGSLIVKGKSLCDLLKHHSNNNSMVDFQNSLESESYGSHILTSLLLIPTDYQPDNIFIENDTNKIIGIDNDECMEFYEIQRPNDGKSYIHFKNILFTFKENMSNIVNPIIANQFIQHQPNVFIFSWLLKINEKDKGYRKLIDLAFHHDDFLLQETNKSLKFPSKFKKGWIGSMLSRFKLIKSLLMSNNCRITYQDLFKEVLPIACIYYQLLAMIKESPIQQIEAIYNKELSVEGILFKFGIDPTIYQKKINLLNLSSDEKLEISIVETIQELIINSEENDFDSPSDLINWIEIILKFKSEIGMDELRLHSSFYKSTKSLLAKLFSGGAEFNLINNFITITNFNIKELSKIDSNENGADINDQLPLLHSTIYSNNPKLLQQISYLVNTLKVNIDLVHDDLTALDLSAKCNNFQSFVLLVELGAGKVFNPSIISKFYNSLPSNQKLDFKPHLQTLFHTNPNAAWCISLNCLLPECGSQLPIDSKIKTISTVVKGRRKISDEHYYSLFNKEDGTPMKKNQYDKRSIPSIRDDYGNCIYIKFDHQFPGIEIAVSKLSEFLFGHCSPCCELGSIEDFPILLVQEVNGEPLIDILEKNPEIIDKIDASNISKQLIMGILTNNSNGDLNNFIVTTTKKKVHYSQNNLGNIESEKQYKIYSIENEHCFMPSTSKKSKKSEAFFKKFSLHVMPSILLFNQMNDPVHQDVIDSISSLNIDNFCEKWLKFLENYDSTSLNHFKDIQQGHDRKKSIVGVTFGIEVSKILYPKLIHLKHLTNKNERTSINHLQLLEYLEPMVSNRIKPILNNFCTIIDRYDQLKQSIQNCQTILVRNPSYNIEHIRNIHHPSAFLLEPFDTQNIQEINNKNSKNNSNNINNNSIGNNINTTNNSSSIIGNNNNNKNNNNNEDDEIPVSDDYGPEKALRELDRMKKRYSNINQIFNYIQDGVIQNISDFDLEEYLKKANFENLTKNQHSLLFKAFKSRSIGTVHIKNCDNLQLKILKKLNLNNLTEIDFSGCKNLEYIKNGKFLNSPLNLPSLKTLIIRNCKKLFGLRIECLNLETLIASDCISLKDFDVNSPILKTLDLNSSIKNSNVFNFLKRFKKLTFLDISNSKGIETIVELEFPELEVLEAKSISNCVKIILGLPVIESINFEDCIDMREIKSKSNHSMIWNALKSCPNKIIFEKKQINLNLIGSDIKELPIRNETEVELVDTNYFQLFNNEEKKKNYYKIQQGLEIGDIPNIVNSIKIHDGFCQILKPGILPDSVKTLYLNDIKVPLEVGSIPSSVKNLTLNNDFGRVLTKDIIPTGVQFLDIHNIKLQLEIESIPSSVTYLNFHDGFDHILYPGIIPEGVKILHFQNLKKPLVVGSIPNSVKRLTITEAVPFKLIPGIIPSMVNFLYLYDVKEELQIGSIPSSVTSLVLNYKFNSPLLPYLIPHSVRSLDLYNLNQQLLPGSIPSSVEILSFQDGFNLKLISSLIPKDVLTLHLHDIKQPLEIGSIPSVKSLILHDKFNQRLSVGIIPEGVEFLNLYNLKQQLEVGSIPNSIKEITLGKNFDKEIPPFVIPIGTKVIIANQLN